MQINEDQLKKFILDSGLISREDFDKAVTEAEEKKQKPSLKLLCLTWMTCRLLILLKSVLGSRLCLASQILLPSVLCSSNTDRVLMLNFKTLSKKSRVRFHLPSRIDMEKNPSPRWLKIYQSSKLLTHSSFMPFYKMRRTFILSPGRKISSYDTVLTDCFMTQWCSKKMQPKVLLPVSRYCQI